MRKQNLVILFCLISLHVGLSKLQAQQVFKTTSASVIGYLEYVPLDYNSNSNKYPIVIFLHGIGERGANSTDPAVLSTTIQSVAKLGPPNYVKNGTQFPFMLISPQLKNNFGTWPAWYVMEVINHVKTYLRVDEKRIYLTGLSLGGGGVWMTAQDYAELFAAIAPVCGGYNTPSKACNIAVANLPVWAFHGDQDTVVPMSKTINMVNAINNCTPAPNPLAKLTIYPGVGHSAWTNAYKTDNTIHNPNVYQWMLSYTNTSNKGNKIPVANAGSDQTKSLTSTINITGSGSDTDGTITSYLWSQLGGPNTATLTNKTTSTLATSNLALGVYMFSLRITDNSGNTDTDYVKLTVQAPNTLPVANAGADKSVTLPTNSVSVVGSGTDPDGTITAYAWTKVSGSTATLSGTTTTNFTASNLAQGSYVFRLTVTDNKGAKKSDDMCVTVANGTNILPVANAGPDKVITLPTNSVTISGIGTDADGTITCYKWTKIKGGTSASSGQTTPTLTVSNLLEGAYVFRLVVTDNTGAMHYDDMCVTVADGTNILPVANAGPDKVITLPTNSVTISGIGTDADGTITCYKWTKIKGGTSSSSGQTTPTLTVSNLLEGAYAFRLVVTDNTGATHYDDMLITVKSAITTSARTATSSEMLTVVEDASIDKTELLADLASAELKNSTVVVFNGEGKKIYSESWGKDSYKEVLTEKGFYIYNVIKDGRRMDAGKIYIQ